MGNWQQAGIKSRSLNSIQITFMYKGRECRETIKLPPTKPNVQYCARLRSEILRRIELGNFVYSEYFPNSKFAYIEVAKIPTFAEFSKKWIESNIHLAKSTQSTYRKHLNKHWLPIYGETKINKITYSEIMHTLSQIGLAAKTRNNVIIPLRRILDTAFIDGIISINPADRIRNIKVQKPEPDPFTIYEVELILDYLTNQYNEQIVNYFEFVFFTGLRPSELIELKWGDIEERTVTVRRAKVEGEVKGTKSSKVRIVELNERAKSALIRQRKHTAMLSNHVFHNPITNMTWADQRKQSSLYWTPTLRNLKLRDRVPYQCRHTYATLMLMAGSNPMWVAKQLGHANMNITLEVYARWIDLADKSRELDKVNLAIYSTDTVQLKNSS